MRITAIDVHWLRLPLPAQVADAMTDLSFWDFIAVRVATDDGPVGWGYNCTIAEGSEALVTLLAKDLAPRFIGRDPFLVRRLWQELYLDRHFTGITGVSVQGVAAIEIALWDIIAKSCRQPLWRLLGGYNDDRIPAYSTDSGWLGLYGGGARRQCEGRAARRLPRLQDEDRQAGAGGRRAAGWPPCVAPSAPAIPSWSTPTAAGTS